MSYDYIPSELHGLQQWLNWRLETRKGKPTKVPYSPRAPHTRASSTAADTWGTYDEALMALQRGDVNGLGFVFTADDDYTGIDLDKCIDAAGVLEPRAQSIVDEMDSYTELSPSGRGLHIIVRGKLPPGRRRHGRIEVYDQGRYFTMTGDSFGPPRPVALRDIELEIFIETYLADDSPTRPASPLPAPAPSGDPMPDWDVLLRILSCAAGPPHSPTVARRHNRLRQRQRGGPGPRLTPLVVVKGTAIRSTGCFVRVRSSVPNGTALIIGSARFQPP